MNVVSNLMEKDMAETMFRSIGMRIGNPFKPKTILSTLSSMYGEEFPERLW